MDTSRVQELFRRAVASDDAAAMREGAAHDAEVFPAPAPAVTLRRVTGGHTVWVAEADMDCGGDRWQAVVIFELDGHGLIARETRYYPREFEAPPGARN